MSMRVLDRSLLCSKRLSINENFRLCINFILSIFVPMSASLCTCACSHYLSDHVIWQGYGKQSNSADSSCFRFISDKARVLYLQ